MSDRRLCPYHTDSLTWDVCTEDFKGCEVEEARIEWLVYMLGALKEASNVE